MPTNDILDLAMHAEGRDECVLHQRHELARIERGVVPC